MGSSDINVDGSVSNDKCHFRESSSQSSTETVPNTPESSTSADQEHRYPEREHHPAQRQNENT